MGIIRQYIKDKKNVSYILGTKDICNVKNIVISIPNPIVLIQDGHSEIYEPVRSNLCYLICLRHWIRPDESDHKADVFFYPKRPIFLHACASFSGLPSNTSTRSVPLLSNATTFKHSLYISKNSRIA